MSEIRKIVLDTNCLIASLSRHSEYYPVWSKFQSGEKTSSIVAKNVIDLLLKSKNVEYITPHFKFRLIEADHDDDKFVDCAFAANATYIVSDDSHFEVLKEIQFPKLLVLKLKKFLELLQAST